MTRSLSSRRWPWRTEMKSASVMAIERSSIAASRHRRTDEWLWVDTCCIDKRSSAELSEAINSMYRWYANAKVCYAYLHDVPGSSLPTARDKRYFDFNGWPEWFSRGWTLQELIAPTNVQFLNKNWQTIGDKRTLAPILEYITGVPEDILVDGLRGNRPCVAQIMSWAAHRTTTRVEDRAYSLMGLLDINMPMLYGEGRKAFHRLQLETIRTSNDQSIFAWYPNRQERNQPGSILADDPSCFELCDRMELMGHDSRRIHPICQKVRPRRRAALHRGSTRRIPGHQSRHPNLAVPPSLFGLAHTLRSPTAMPPWSKTSTSDHPFGFVGIRLL